MRKLAWNCISVSSPPKLGALLGILTLRRDLKNVDLGKQAPWSSFVAANSTTPIQNVPVLIAQTQDDPLVAASVTRKFAQRLCSNRVRVRWIDLPGKDHATTARQSAFETLRWIDDRFAGGRAPSNCGKSDLDRKSRKCKNKRRSIMDIANILKQTGAIDKVAQQLGVDEKTAQAGAAALLPAILGGFKKTTQAQPGGLGALGGLLGQLGGGGLFDAVVSPEPTPVGKGNDVLGEIFGSKDVSRTVAGNASAQTGIDPALLKKMLPILAMLVTGYLAKQGGSATGAGGLGGMLGNLLGGATGGGQSQAIAGGGLGGIGSLLDLNGDGNPLDDLLGMASKFGR
jgi:hypothetical protein